MGILATIAGIFTSGISRDISDAIKSFNSAKTDVERIASQERISQLQAIRDIQVASAASRIDGVIRALYAVPPGVYFAKLWIWDKALGWGTTDGISEDMRWVATAVLAFFFLHGVIKRR